MVSKRSTLWMRVLCEVISLGQSARASDSLDPRQKRERDCLRRRLPACNVSQGYSWSNTFNLLHIFNWSNLREQISLYMCVTSCKHMWLNRKKKVYKLTLLVGSLERARAGNTWIQLFAMLQNKHIWTFYSFPRDNFVFYNNLEVCKRKGKTIRHNSYGVLIRKRWWVCVSLGSLVNPMSMREPRKEEWTTVTSAMRRGRGSSNI